VRERITRPVIVIRTDDDLRTPRSNNPNVIYARQVDLLLELSVVTSNKIAVGNEQVWQVGWPQTDPALEAKLDMLEWQCYNALFGLSAWGQWWTKNWIRGRIISRPEFLREAITTRLAARTVAITITTADDCLPSWRFDEVPAQTFIPPQLKSVLDKIAADGAGDLVSAAAELQAAFSNQGWPQDVPAPHLKTVQLHQTIGYDDPLTTELLGDVPPP
jgi:hypothetical protein